MNDASKIPVSSQTLGRSARVGKPVHVISSDSEALDVAAALAGQFRVEAAKRDRERILPRDEIEALTQAGFFGITVPRQYGGADVTAVTLAEAFRLLSAADPSIGQIPQNHFCWMPAFSNGTGAQAEFFFRRILAGDRIGNAHSEDTRKRPGDYEHQLTRVDGGWRITGRKYYSTGAIFAQWIPFIAYFGEGDAKQSFLYFADASDPGLTVIDDWDGMGQRTTASGTTIFENVFVPDDNVLPMISVTDTTRSFALISNLIHAAIDLGIAEEALADAKHYIRNNNRPWTGNPHPEHAQEPFVVRDFGQLGLKARVAALALKEAAHLIDEARAHPSQEAKLAARLSIADARILASEAATTIADQFFLLTGARATLGKYDLDRHWRNSRTHSLHDPMRWKEFHLGNYHLNGIAPPQGSYI